MNKNIADTVKSVRKFFGLQQTEISTITGVTQGTISKIEAATMKPDMIFWFNFVRTFRLKDPYCCLYGSLELEVLDEIDFETFQSPLLPVTSLSKEDFYFVVKDIQPLADYLKTHVPIIFKSLLEKHQIQNELFNINNHPLPIAIVEDILEIFKKNLVSKKLNKMKFDFSKSLGHLIEHDLPLSFEGLIQSLSLNNQWCDYSYIEDNQYQVDFSKKNSSFLKEIENSSFLMKYLSLQPFFFQASHFINHSLSEPLVTEKGKSILEIRF